MPMPMWLCFAAPTGSSPTSAASMAHLYAQQTTTTGAYNHALGTNSPVWITGSTPTATTSATTIWWSNIQDGWYEQEASVEHSQYVALARRRVELTEEQRAVELAAAESARIRAMAQEHRDAERRAMQEQSRAEREAAVARSRELLLSHLTPEQRRTFEDNNWFIVEGGATRTRYRIRTLSYTHNIEILDSREDRAVCKICGHLRDHLPLYDHHVAQKISLEFDEEAFVRLCNRSAV